MTQVGRFMAALQALDRWIERRLLRLPDVEQHRAEADANAQRTDEGLSRINQVVSQLHGERERVGSNWNGVERRQRDR